MKESGARVKILNRFYYWIAKNWYLYRGVKFSHPVKRYHFERFGYYIQLLDGETPRIPKEKLYKPNK